MKNYLKFLYAYNTWANARILDACAQLTQEEFLRGQGFSNVNPSIRDTLVHQMGAQEIWLARWGGVSPTRLLDPEDFGTVALLHQYWNEVDQHTHAFIDAAEDDVLLGVMEYTSTKGEPFSDLRWQTMVHQANHATQHRSEAALLLTARNHSPGNLDVISYMREQQP
jgi:uncharacterized damage-inducible protein DinB